MMIYCRGLSTKSNPPSSSVTSGRPSTAPQPDISRQLGLPASRRIPGMAWNSRHAHISEDSLQAPGYNSRQRTAQ